MERIIQELQAELAASGKPEIAENGKNFFKEDIKLHGLKSGDVRKIGKTYLARIKHLPKKEIFALCDELWRSGYHEETSIATEWAYSIRKQFEESDFAVFERWLKEYVSNWAACDMLCNHSIAELLMTYPSLIGSIKEWAHSSNRWVKRGAAVTFIIPARKGLFIDDIFEIADTLMSDSDDLVQKGYGWALKAASESNPQQVFEYLMKHKTVMPRTAFRYALEKMPAAMKAEAMKK